jgi:hypothetical protein
VSNAMASKLSFKKRFVPAIFFVTWLALAWFGRHAIHDSAKFELYFLFPIIGAASNFLFAYLARWISVLALIPLIFVDLVFLLGVLMFWSGGV